MDLVAFGVRTTAATSITCWRIIPVAIPDSHLVAATQTKKRVADESKITGIIDPQKDVGGWPELKSTPASSDTDHDRMSDEWERKHEFDPNDAADGSKDSDGDGYTNLEEYLNEILSTGSQGD